MIKKKKNKIEFIIVLLILFVFVFIFEIPRKFFNISRLTYDERLNIIYDFPFPMIGSFGRVFLQFSMIFLIPILKFFEYKKMI